MDRDKVKALVIEKIREVKDVQEKIEEESFYNDFALDSFDAVELIIKIEKKFKIEIPDEDLKDIENKTIGDIINYIYEQLKNHDSNNLNI
jgi:acyl carrier protein